MTHYKIINKETKHFLYLNKEQKENFFTKNAFQDSKGVKKYNIINLTELKTNKIFNIIMYVLSFLIACTLLYILCYSFNIIDNINL